MLSRGQGGPDTYIPLTGRGQRPGGVEERDGNLGTTMSSTMTSPTPRLEAEHPRFHLAISHPVFYQSLPILFMSVP